MLPTDKFCVRVLGKMRGGVVGRCRLHREIGRGEKRELDRLGCSAVYTGPPTRPTCCNQRNSSGKLSVTTILFQHLA